MNNPWEPAFIEGASMDIELKFARDVLRLRGAELLNPEIDAGSPARVRLTLSPYTGPEITRVVSVAIPANLAGQNVTLDIVPGYMEEHEDAAPDNLSDLVRSLETATYPPQSAVIAFSAGSSAVTFKGHVAKNLPPGALDALRTTTSSVVPDAFQTTIRQVVPLSQFMVGRDKVTVSVRPVLR
jgi:hypothetical protein